MPLVSHRLLIQSDAKVLTIQSLDGAAKGTQINISTVTGKPLSSQEQATMVELIARHCMNDMEELHLNDRREFSMQLFLTTTKPDR